VMPMPTKVGIIGAGDISTNMHIPVLRAMQAVSIRWIGDIDLARAERIGRANRLAVVSLEGDYSEIPEVDIVLLAIPLPPRRNYFDFYTRGETAIFAEKPLTINAAEHRELLVAYEPWRLAVGYQRRYYATNQLLRKLIRSEAFGPLQKIVVNEGGRVTRTGGSGAYQDLPVTQGGGIVKNLGCHSIDLAFWLTGASSAIVKNRSIQWDGDTDRGCQADIKLLNLNGISGSECGLLWDVSWLESRSNMIELQFENAFLRCPASPASTVQLRDGKGQELAALDATHSASAVTTNQACYLEWLDVISAVKSRTEQPASVRSTLATAVLIDALLER